VIAIEVVRLAVFFQREWFESIAELMLYGAKKRIGGPAMIFYRRELAITSAC
jgi:hypothetical protein